MLAYFKVSASGFIAIGCIVLGLVGACRRGERRLTVEDTPWARGDQVVVEARAGEFYEAQVVAVDGDQLRVQRVHGGVSTTLSSQDVYRLPSPGVPAQGQYLVCAPAETNWIPCRTSRVLDGKVEAVDPEGREFTVPRNRVVIPSELTTLNIERRFADSHRNAEFRTRAARAGRPLVDPEWSPGPRERVLVQRPEGWFSAVVHELDKHRVHVRWDADRRLTEVPLTSIVPEGPYETDPVVGGFVLARPQSPAEPWELLRVHSMVDEHSVVLTNSSGERRTMQLRDVVPLGGAKVDH